LALPARGPALHDFLVEDRLLRPSEPPDAKDVRGHVSVVERLREGAVHEVRPRRIHRDEGVEATDHIPIGLASIEPTRLEDRVALRAPVLVRQDVVVREDERFSGIPNEAGERARRDRVMTDRDAAHRRPHLPLIDRRGRTPDRTPGPLLAIGRYGVTVSGVGPLVPTAVPLGPCPPALP